MAQPTPADKTRWLKLPQVFPSLLANDFGVLDAEIAAATALGIEALHWDVMDGHFVPNLTYGPPVVKSCRAKSAGYFDAHLMMSDPGQHLDAFLDAGCDGVTIHIEAVPQPTALLRKIRAAGRWAGLAFNPGTPVAAVEPFLADCDLALAMSVQPGFGGQAFNPVALDKLKRLRQLHPDLLLQIDGGIAPKTIKAAVDAGANLLVVGSAFYGAKDRAAALADLRAALGGGP